MSRLIQLYHRTVSGLLQKKISKPAAMSPDVKPVENKPWMNADLYQKTRGKAAAKIPIKMSLVKDKKYAWCSCGYSKKQPLCDGAHHKNDTELKPMWFTANKTTKAFICRCKHTSNPPFCDGTHLLVMLQKNK